MSLSKAQEPKYDTNADGKIVNRATGKVIPDNEPVMIFRAKDARALFGLKGYLDACNDPAFRAVVKRRIADFEAFQKANPELVREPHDPQPTVYTSPVVSSNVEAVGYHTESLTLAVEFKNGAVHHYLNVPETSHAELMAATSIGSHVAKHVRPIYDSIQVKAAEPQPA